MVRRSFAVHGCWLAGVVGVACLPVRGQSELGKLTVDDGRNEDQFGFSISISEKTMMVGALRGGASKFRDTGAVYVFGRDGHRWSQTGKLVPDGGRDGDRFGISVAVDGEHAIVGASRDRERAPRAGGAYVYRSRPSGGTSGWARDGKLTASDAAAGDMFGFAVDLDGEVAVVGAYRDDDAGIDSGSAYVFACHGGRWAQAQKLVCPGPAAGFWFGRSVALAGDVLAIGASGSDVGGMERGAVYVYVRTGDGWKLDAALRASDGAKGDRFGRSVAITADPHRDGAHRMIVGAFWADTISGDADTKPQGRDAGAAYIFERDGRAWKQRAKLTAINAAADDLFGVSVAISGDYAVVGAMQNDEKSSDAGSAYFFRRVGDRWTQPFHVTGSAADPGDWFGFSVAIDGNYAAIGSIRDDDRGFDSGSIDLYSVVTVRP